MQRLDGRAEELKCIRTVDELAVESGTVLEKAEPARLQTVFLQVGKGAPAAEQVVKKGCVRSTPSFSVTV